MNTPTANIALDPAARREAERLVLKCGIHANLKGFSRLIDAVVLYGAHDYTLCELYRTIAELRSLKPKTVIREISYALSQSPRLEKRLSELVGSVFCSDEIHSGLVIAALATLLKSKHAARDVKT
ncbi:MAG: hypothetical protein J1G04_01590 [Clostridiales bacterium]|nr:hypothetical protein [Clostridiales bacterium]